MQHLKLTVTVTVPLPVGNPPTLSPRQTEHSLNFSVTESFSLLGVALPGRTLTVTVRGTLTLTDNLFKHEFYPSCPNSDPEATTLPSPRSKVRSRRFTDHESQPPAVGRPRAACAGSVPGSG